MRNKISGMMIVTVLSFFAFFMFGFTDNLKGPVLPALLDDLGISYSRGSMLLLLAYTGFLAAILVSGILATRRGNRPVLLIAGIALSAGAAGIAAGAGFPMLYLMFALIGYGIGSIEVGANGLVASVYEGRSGKYLNLLAVFHGAGAMVAPFLAGLMLSMGIGWRTVYGIVVPLAILQAVLFFIWRKPGPHEVKAAGSGEKINFRMLLSRDLVLYSVFLVFYVCAEIGVAAWMVDFLLKSKGYDVRTGSVMLSVYFGCIMAGRFIGSFFVEKIGYKRILLISAVLSTLLLLSGILLPPPFAFLIPLAGLFFSVMFPTATADAAVRSPAPRTAVFSVLFFCAGIGGMIGPWITGVCADMFGIGGGFLINVFFGAAMFLSLAFLKTVHANPKDAPAPEI